MRAVTDTEFSRATHDLQVRFTPGSLDVQTKIELDAGRRRVFDALLHIAAWWPDHGRPGSRIVFEPRVGGRFFESCDDGCGILLGQLSRLLPPDEFAIEGRLGSTSRCARCGRCGWSQTVVAARRSTGSSARSGHSKTTCERRRWRPGKRVTPHWRST
jgi:hypothetical protein